MKHVLPLALLLLGACQQSPTAPANVDVDVDSNQTAPLDGNSPVTAPVLPVTDPAANDRMGGSLPEPTGPIDPKSGEAAGQVVQSYGALIEQDRWAEADKLWRDSATARAFRGAFAGDVHLEIGVPGPVEGAAGSLYVTMPVVFYGKDKAGKAYRRAADIVLRRSNDVPGSTKEQRRWRIDRIDYKPA